MSFALLINMQIFDGYCLLSLFWVYKFSRDQKEERDVGEDNEEEDPKCSRKKKPKLSLKADSKEEEERDEETVSTHRAALLRVAPRPKAPALEPVTRVHMLVP